jgi:hypothetical protein
MNIRFERSGGFTAIPIRLVVDTSQLDPAAGQGLVKLIEQSQFYSLPEKIQSPAVGADQFQYKLTVEDAGHSHTVETGDPAAPGSLQPLLQQLTFMARSARSK